MDPQGLMALMDSKDLLDLLETPEKSALEVQWDPVALEVLVAHLALQDHPVKLENKALWVPVDLLDHQVQLGLVGSLESEESLVGLAPQDLLDRPAHLGQLVLKVLLVRGARQDQWDLGEKLDNQVQSDQLARVVHLDQGDHLDPQALLAILARWDLSGLLGHLAHLALQDHLVYLDPLELLVQLVNLDLRVLLDRKDHQDPRAPQE